MSTTTSTITLCPLGPNHNEVRTGTVDLVFSYSTLVAVHAADGKRYKTNEYHSVTTSKHINKSGFKDATPVSPDELAKLAEG